MVETKLISRIVWSVLTTVQVGSAAQQLSNIPRQDFWVTDGAVNAIAVTNDRVFIGGDFRYVGPYTGGGVPIDVNTMQPVAKYPKVNGSVHSVEPDGQGGWFIGGGFTTVGGRPRTNLAHITAAGEVNTNWTAHATGGEERGLVTKLALDGDTLYAAGSFTHLGGEPRVYVGALLSASGAVKSWAPQVSSNVLSLAVSPTAVYLGGMFLQLNGVSRKYVGAVDKVAAQTLPWNVYDSPLRDFYFVSNTFPRALAVGHGLVFVPGLFANMFDYYGLVAFREADAVSVWGAGKANSSFVYELKAHDGELYVGGAFFQIGGDGENGHVSRNRVAALDALTGQVLPWHPTNIGGGLVFTIAFAGNNAYIGGRVQSPNPAPSSGDHTNANNIVCFDLTTGEEVGRRRPFNNEVIYSLAVQGNQIYFGGAFDSLAGVPHQHLAELDRRDGSLKPWNPQVNGPVTALTLAPDRLLIAGVFSAIQGQPRNRLAALGLPLLDVLPWAPAVSADPGGMLVVRALVPTGDHLLLAGEFTAVAGQPRSNLAKVSLETGAPSSWRADTDGAVDTAIIAGDHVYVGGRFSMLGGQPRPHLGSVELASGQVTPWNPAPDNWVTSLSANSTAVYSAGYFANVSGAARTGYAAHDRTTGTLLPWSLETLQPRLNDSRVLATETAVYATGFFRHPDPVWGPTLIEVSTDAGTPSAWDTRPVSYLDPYLILRDEDTLFLAGKLVTGAGPKRMGLAVYEPAGFSRFTHVNHESATIELHLSADQGREFTIERTTDFDTWTGISTTTAWEGILELEDTTPPANGPAYYRARTSQP